MLNNPSQSRLKAELQTRALNAATDIYGLAKTSHSQSIGPPNRCPWPRSNEQCPEETCSPAIRRIFAAWPAGRRHVRPRPAAEPYRPDPKLVEAARKEGQVLWYTTLIVDQIVRPLIKLFQAQVPGIDVRFVRIDSGQQVVRLMNEARAGRVQADMWSVIDGAAPLAQNGVSAPFDIASARDLPASLVDPNRRWIATNLATRSLAYQYQPGQSRPGAAQLRGSARSALEAALWCGTRMP